MTQTVFHRSQKGSTNHERILVKFEQNKELYWIKCWKGDPFPFIDLISNTVLAVEYTEPYIFKLNFSFKAIQWKCALSNHEIFPTGYVGIQCPILPFKTVILRNFFETAQKNCRYEINIAR